MLRCDAYGYCAELLPDVVHRDEWGYPSAGADVDADRLKAARRAVAACPRLALRLTSI
jgi:ferredoxin